MDFYFWLYSIIGGIVLIFLVIMIWFISTSNSFKKMAVKIEESESSIDVALTKRYHLLTKMVSATKGYAKHEVDTLSKVVNLRQPEKSASISDKQNFANGLSETIAKLNVLVEQYPDLKASTNFSKLQDASVEVEENLQSARRVYNSNVSIYNQKVVVFPSSIVAEMKKFMKKDFFEVENYKKEDIDFNF